MDVSNINTSVAATALRLFGSASSDGTKQIGQSGNKVATLVERDRGPTKDLWAEVEEAVSSIEKFAQSMSRSLSFNLDNSTGQVLVKVTDSLSGEVIRQIPSEEALRLAERLDEVRSLLFKAEV